MPQRFLAGHSTRKFGHGWVEEDRGHKTPCHIWQGCTNNYGYAVRRTNGKLRQVHVEHFEAVHGPVPPGLELDHLCRQRPCVNQEHLEAVTPKTNTLRGNGPTALNAQKTHCPQGHPLDGLRANGRRYCCECQRQQRSAYNERRRLARKQSSR